MTSCEAIRSRLEELRVDLLPPPERDVAEAHLSACPDCASRWRRIQEVEKALIESAEPMDVAKVRDVVRHAKDRVAREKRRKEIIPMAAAALLLLSILAWLTGVPGTGAGPAGSQEAFEEKRLGLLPPNGVVVWSPDGRRWACRVEEGGARRVDVEDRKGEGFKHVGDPYFSADGRKVAYVAGNEAKKRFVVVQDLEKGETTKGELFDDVTGWEGFQGGGGSRSGLLRWSPAGASLAYTGRRGNEQFAVIDGAAQGPYGNVHQFAWSPDGKAFAYVAVQGQDSFVVRDGKKGEVFDFVSHLTFNPDGRSLAFVAKEGEYRLIWGDRRSPGFVDIRRPVFSPDGKRLAYATPMQVWVDGDAGAGYNSVGDPVFSPDGTRVAHIAEIGKAAFIVMRTDRGETKGEPFIRVGAPVFSPDGRSVAYPAGRGEKQVMVVGDRPGEKFSEVGAPVFSPDGRVVAYRAVRYGKEVVVVGSQVGEEVDRVLWGPVFSADGKKVSYRAQKGQELWSKVVDVP